MNTKRPAIVAITACAVLLLAACQTQSVTLPPSESTPEIVPTALPTDVPATLAPTVERSPTPVPSPTEVPSPTPSPDAITADNADTLTQVLVLEGADGPLYGVAVSPDGGLIAGGGTDFDVRVYDGGTGELQYQFDRHRGWVYTMVFVLDGTRLITGSRDQTIQLWDMATGERFFGARTSGEVFRLAASPDGMHVAAANTFSASGEVWDANTGATLFPLEGHPTRLRSVAYSQDGLWLATGDKDGLILLRDPATGLQIQQLQGAVDEVLALVFIPDTPLLAAGMKSGEIVIWNTVDSTVVETWRPHTEVWDLDASPDGSVLFSAGSDGTVQVWNAATYERIISLSGHAASVRSIDVSRDGSTLVSGGDDNRIRVWRLAP